MMKGCGPVSRDIWRSSLDPPPRPPDAPAPPAPPAPPSVSDTCVGAPPDSCSCSACCCNCLGDCDSCRGLRPRLPVDGNRGGDI